MFKGIVLSQGLTPGVRAIAITDNTGQVVNTYAYSPEGLVGAQETIPNPFTYVGRFGVMAEGNGLYFMRARYYDPEVGRFINKDPIGYRGGINLFTYARNNPVNFIDANGKISGAALEAALTVLELEHIRTNIWGRTSVTI